MVVGCPILDDPPEELRVSPWRLFGGVSKLPTLAMVVWACDDCDAVTVLVKGYLCIGGGGSSKLPNCGA
jgi:hypothetical protein